MPACTKVGISSPYKITPSPPYIPSEKLSCQCPRSWSSGPGIQNPHSSLRSASETDESKSQCRTNQNHPSPSRKHCTEKRGYFKSTNCLLASLSKCWLPWYILLGLQRSIPTMKGLDGCFSPKSKASSPLWCHTYGNLQIFGPFVK